MITINVLLVDDEERFLSTTKIILEKRGFKVNTALQGVEALDILEKQRIDVVILDVKMPGLDGISVLRKIKERHQQVEVILLTGHASVETAVNGLKIGAFDYLMKPCDIAKLLAKINLACSQKTHAEEQIRKAKIDKIISHPWAVFDDDK
ncbi:response regulator [candidate division CSSED10-310 bacterium]|uniref:Response regulator n=1 Tax=candidate division CSSED10-310 bacterium TaxID=2855610 RepID=A0ABV6Z3W2_UNCC1